mmetsp:Transcript_18083/g.38612  ORF Transcript_18083/g.38612 Transcript_18083/m.38612 type:complete len:288 (-) Transcript_18083:99-962(-)
MKYGLQALVQARMDGRDAVGAALLSELYRRALGVATQAIELCGGVRSGGQHLVAVRGLAASIPHSHCPGKEHDPKATLHCGNDHLMAQPLQPRLQNVDIHLAAPAFFLPLCRLLAEAVFPHGFTPCLGHNARPGTEDDVLHTGPICLHSHDNLQSHLLAAGDCLACLLLLIRDFATRASAYFRPSAKRDLLQAPQLNADLCEDLCPQLCKELQDILLCLDTDLRKLLCSNFKLLLMRGRQPCLASFGSPCLERSLAPTVQVGTDRPHALRLARQAQLQGLANGGLAQ